MRTPTLEPALLQLLCCPETYQPLHCAEPALLQQLNGQIASGTLKNRAGHTVSAPLEAGLLRADGKFLYPVQGRLPILLMEEAIPLRIS